MSYNPNGINELKFFTVFNENGLGISMLWIINLSASVVWSFWILDLLENHSFDCRRDFHEQKLPTIHLLKLPRRDFHEQSSQISAYWNFAFLQIYFKFCHSNGVEVAFILICAILKLKNYSRYKDLKQRENYIFSNWKTNLKTLYICNYMYL